MSDSEHLATNTSRAAGRRALITGITGQDGSYLAELLLAQGYEVHGLIRQSSTGNTSRIQHLLQDSHAAHARLCLHFGDVTDGQHLANLVLALKPDEIYNLAAQSHVQVSFDEPIYTVMTDGVGALNVLEAARLLNKHQSVRVYQAGSSEMFGRALQIPQTEATPFNPQSPYACAKVYAYFQTINYRRCYDLFASNGILFNHESPRRGEAFVTRKITRAATRIKLGLQAKLCLGNLDARRDWGYAKDYVRAMWLMLQQEQPDDFVIATGKDLSVRDFLMLVFSQLDLDWRNFVETDARYLRPAEVDYLVGDSTKARQTLGWTAQTDIYGLAKLMVDYDLELARHEATESNWPSG